MRDCSEAVGQKESTVCLGKGRGEKGRDKLCSPSVCMTIDINQKNANTATTPLSTGSGEAVGQSVVLQQPMPFLVWFSSIVVCKDHLIRCV
jgi:hypothetical protein